jgi:transcriptional regulator with XRE-family HTH domain
MYLSPSAEILADPEAPKVTAISCMQETSRTSGRITTHRTYGLPVPTDPKVRLAAFTAFVNRALDRAKAQRALSVEQVAELAGISANTVYLWRSGSQWKNFPKGESVEAFCDALGIPPATAYAILWPGQEAKPAAAEPLDTDPDLIALARKLNDPNVAESERHLIRETLRMLAARPSKPDDGVRRRRTG